MQKGFTASATGPIAGTTDAGAGKTFRQLGMKVSGTAPDSIVNLETSPDGTTWTIADVVTGPNWGYAGSHAAQRRLRANVVSLGTGAPPLAVNLTWY